MKVFEIQPASNSILFIIIPLTILLLVILFIFVYAFIASKNTKFIIAEKTLDIQASLYSRKIQLDQIKRNEIKLVNIINNLNWSPKWRTNGIGFSGYKEGWFKLHNGEKGLLFMTDKRKVVLIPTINNYYIMVSPTNPTEFIQALSQPE